MDFITMYLLGIGVCITLIILHNIIPKRGDIIVAIIFLLLSWIFAITIVILHFSSYNKFFTKRITNYINNFKN